jgi:hypothetical protein
MVSFAVVNASGFLFLPAAKLANFCDFARETAIQKIR